jgi:hypothetical protein
MAPMAAPTKWEAGSSGCLSPIGTPSASATSRKPDFCQRLILSSVCTNLRDHFKLHTVNQYCFTVHLSNNPVPVKSALNPVKAGFTRLIVGAVQFTSAPVFRRVWMNRLEFPGTFIRPIGIYAGIIVFKREGKDPETA